MDGRFRVVRIDVDWLYNRIAVYITEKLGLGGMVGVGWGVWVFGFLESGSVSYIVRDLVETSKM